MVDVYQVVYEHSAGLTVSFKTKNLKITYLRPHLTITIRPDGEKIVNDSNVFQRVFDCDAVITGADLNTMNGWLIGSITYSGAYPRLTTINLSSALTLTNIEVAVTAFAAQDMGDGQWAIKAQFTEKTQ